MRLGGLHIKDEHLLTYAGVVAVMIVFGPEIGKMIGSQLTKTAGGIATGAIDGAGSTVKEATIAVGEQMGMPRTNYDKCVTAIDEGSAIDGALYCDALDYWKNLHPFPYPTFGGKFGDGATPEYYE